MSKKKNIAFWFLLGLVLSVGSCCPFSWHEPFANCDEVPTAASGDEHAVGELRKN